MQHVPHHDLARGVRVTVGIAMTALFCAASGLIAGKSTIIWQQLHFDRAWGLPRLRGQKTEPGLTATLLPIC
jgi:hypothetical protein